MADSPSGTNLPPPAEMKTSNWRLAAGWEAGCSLAIQPVRSTTHKKWFVPHLTSDWRESANDCCCTITTTTEQNTVRNLFLTENRSYHFLLWAQSNPGTPLRCAPQLPGEGTLSIRSAAVDECLKNTHVNVSLQLGDWCFWVFKILKKIKPLHV